MAAPGTPRLVGRSYRRLLGQNFVRSPCGGVGWNSCLAHALVKRKSQRTQSWKVGPKVGNSSESWSLHSIPMMEHRGSHMIVCSRESCGTDPHFLFQGGVDKNAGFCSSLGSSNHAAFSRQPRFAVSWRFPLHPEMQPST